MPFSVDEFLSLLEIYNQSILAVHIAAHVLAILAIFFALMRTDWTSRAVSAVLGAMWLWVGMVFFIRDFSGLSTLAYTFGIGFVFQGLLLLYQGSIKGTVQLRPRSGPSGVIGGAFMIWAIAGYPFLSWAVGHAYPRLPMFGVTPGPVVMFTLGMLLWTDETLPKYLLTIPFVWSLIGTVISPVTGVYEDLPLIIVGVVGSVMILKRDRALLEERLKAARGELQ